MPTFRRVRRGIAAVLLVLYLPACYHYVTPKEMTLSLSPMRVQSG